MNVTVLGTGHVGLVTAAALARLGHRVVGVDRDAATIGSLQRGRAHFFEPGLQELLTDGTAAGRLSFSAEAGSVADADLVMICVGTPAHDDGSVDLRAIDAATDGVAKTAHGETVVVVKSTVPSGTTRRIGARLAAARDDARFLAVSSPEFLREGSAVHDTLHPDRIVVGADEPEAFVAMRELLARVIEQGVELIETDPDTAEIAKHASNAFLALKISYANAIARLSERLGTDVVDVTRVMGADPRIGPHFLGAGLGYGGYCFPKDVTAFRALAAEAGYRFGLLDEVATINREAVLTVVEMAEQATGGLDEARVAVLGLAYKAQTDDVRYSPSLALIEALEQRGARVCAHDPQAEASARALIPALRAATSPQEAATDADVVVLATAWPEYRDLAWGSVAAAMRGTVVIDARNALDADAVVDAGLEYWGVGRPRRTAR